MEEVRMLALDERVALALLYYQIPELTEICRPSPTEAINDSDKVHRITQILHERQIPTLSTELTEEQITALATGVKPVLGKAKIKLNYNGVLDDEDGQRLEELFNEGEFAQLGQKTNRPMTTWRLTVDDTVAHELEQIHARWLNNRICILVDSQDGLYWATPDTRQLGTTYQNYIVVPSTTAAAPRHPTFGTAGSSKAMVVDALKTPAPSWRDAVDEMVSRKPHLVFVQTMLDHYLQPAHVQLTHKSALDGKVLLLSYEGHTYRVIGITNQGTLQLSKHLNQGLVYDTTLPVRQVLSKGEWIQAVGE